MENTLNSKNASFLKNLGIEKFNAMQEDVIKATSLGGNTMLLAPTGSGKTLAFLISILNKFRPEHKGVQAMVVAPSRELAIQIEDVFKTMKTSYKVTCCYGGHDIKIEENSLSEAPALIIGTPGRLADHLMRKSFDAGYIKLLVLDEFDKSLQLGFHDQLRVIFKSLSGKQDHLLTSATRLDTWPDFLPFTSPKTLDYLRQQKESKLELLLVKTSSVDKVETLMRLVAGFNQEPCLVFCNHREAVERISFLFFSNKFEHGILHGAMEQIDREKNLIKFRGGAHNVLIATDLASRGLDVPEIKHIVHYQLPNQLEAFTHRNGRTARMHADGKAYLILADDETLPPYIGDTETVEVSPKLQLPPPPLYSCLYFSAGKKDKISKGDIVGLLTKKGGLTGDDIGLITTLDHASFVSVKRALTNDVLTRLQNEKLKKLKVKIALAS